VLTSRRQRRTTRGVQPIGSVQHVFAGLSIDGAVEHTTGDRFFVELPDLHAELFQLGVDAFAPACRDSLNRLVLDNRGAPPAQRRTWPETVRLVCLPPYCPELNPSERVWRDLKDALASRQCPPLEGEQDCLAQLLRAYEVTRRPSLTSDSSLVEAVHARCPL
jgi:hypothetical protein